MSWPATGPVLVALTLFLLFWNRDTGLKKIPIVRFNTYWPDFLNRILFYPKAALLIYAGYEKVLRENLLLFNDNLNKNSTKKAHFVY